MTVDVFVTATVNVTGGLAPAEAAADEDDDDAETTTYYTDKSTKLVYQDVIVLARSGQMYIIRAALDIAEEITHLQATGNAQFSFALRPEVDTRMTDATALGSTTNELIRKYALPIPEVYPPAVGPIPTPEPTPQPTPTPTPDEVETGAGRLPEASPSQVP
jgi:hypothetical protein